MSVIRVQRFKFNETMLWQLSANILKMHNQHFITHLTNNKTKASMRNKYLN